MEARRLKFRFALTLFLIWVVSLGAMALLSGHRPEDHHKAALPR